jgi:phage terminase small subunit
MANPHGGGNRQKSVREHEKAGTFRKERHAQLRMPEPPARRPEMPSGLSEAEQVEWDSLMTDLELQGGVTVTDAKLAQQWVKLYCETEAVAEQQGEAKAGLRVLEDNLGDVEAEDKVALFGQIVALHKTVSKCTDQLRQGRMALRQYLVEMGLTPASRGRIKLPPKDEAPKDEFAAFQLQRVK